MLQIESLSDSESGKACLARTQPATTDNRDPGSLLYNLPYTSSQADRSKNIAGTSSVLHASRTTIQRKPQRVIIRPLQNNNRQTHTMKQNPTTLPEIPNTSYNNKAQPPKVRSTPNYRDPRYYSRSQKYCTLNVNNPHPIIRTTKCDGHRRLNVLEPLFEPFYFLGGRTRIIYCVCTCVNFIRSFISCGAREMRGHLSEGRALESGSFAIL
jgi:hypothetical protein